MSRIIRSSDMQNDGVAAYEHDALEPIVPEHPGGKDYVDPAAILAEAREKAEQKVREAYEEGMHRGTEAGREKFNASVAEAEKLLNNAAEALKDARIGFLDSLEPQIVELAIAIAAQILKREAEESPDLLRSTARAALERILDEEQVTLRVNPVDLDALREHRIELLHQFDGISRLDIVGDESIESGGCIATSETLHVDAQIQTQLEKILERLAE